MGLRLGDYMCVEIGKIDRLNQALDDLGILTLDGLPWKQTDYISHHEYILKCQYHYLCTVFELKIAQDGVNEYFFNRAYRYLYIDGYKYWIVGNVLNRAKVNNDGGRREERLESFTTRPEEADRQQGRAEEQEKDTGEGL